MSKRDFYEILGVTKSSTAEEIKKAYRQMAIKYHPDKNPGDKEAEAKFKEAAEAYEILSNAEKKKRYDQFGHAGMGGGGGYSGGGGMSMDDIFSHFGDIFGGFGGGFGGSHGRSAERHVNKGSNLRIKVKLTLNEISTGVKKTIKVSKYSKCNTCSGSGASEPSAYSTCPTCRGAGHITQITNTFLGQMQTSSTCPTCGGEGKIITKKCPACAGEGIVKNNEVIEIDIPAGVAEGMQLSFRGKGNAGRRNGINGDLIVLIEEEKHAELFRDGNDIIYPLYLNFAEAALGGQIEIPTLENNVKINIEPGTQPGKTLRLRGKGLPEVNGYGKGDLLVNVNVWVPKELSKEEKKTLEKFMESPNFKPAPDKDDKTIFDRVRNIFN